MHFCQDHFDLPNDMENYMRYRIMGTVHHARMKPGCLPTKFECQSDRKRKMPLISKQKRFAVEEAKEVLPLASCVSEEPSTSSVPPDKQKREKWLELAGLPLSYLDKAQLYFCEDHFDMPNDMENYLRYHMMGKQRIQMKSDCVPSKFECQHRDRSVLTPQKSTEIPIIIKKREVKMAVDDSCEIKSVQNTAVTPLTIEHPHSGSFIREESPKCDTRKISKLTYDKGTQVKIMFFRSKAVQINMSNPTITEHRATSPINKTFQSSSKSMFVVKKHSKNKPSTSQDNNICVYTFNKKEATLQTIKKITIRPRFYTGISKENYYIIEYIERVTKIPQFHILLCLKRIRLYCSYTELGDDFGITSNSAKKIFLNNIPIIADVLRPLIINLGANINNFKTKLSTPFKDKYYVCAAVHRIDIKMQKPLNTDSQYLMWCKDKRCYTMKCLISCTPNGLINFVSPCFGGSLSDTYLIESCDFLNCLPKDTFVLADSKFKKIKTYLNKVGICLNKSVRVVRVDNELSESQALQNKEMGDFKRVLGQLREFRMLRPHVRSLINSLDILHDVITIVCCLINLQNSVVTE